MITSEDSLPRRDHVAGAKVAGSRIHSGWSDRVLERPAGTLIKCINTLYYMALITPGSESHTGTLGGWVERLRDSQVLRTRCGETVVGCVLRGALASCAISGNGSVIFHAPYSNKYMLSKGCSCFIIPNVCHWVVSCEGLLPLGWDPSQVEALHHEYCEYIYIYIYTPGSQCGGLGS
ncbi:hypothetical protein FKM82_023180 [Ascaphus truei]